MQVPKLEPPSVGLTAGVLANDAVKPALYAARQRKVSTVDRQHERIVEDRSVEPVRHDEVDSVGIAVHVGTLRPFIDPGEAMHPAFADLAQRRGDRRGLQPVESGLQTVIVACAGTATGEGEDLAWPCRQEARRAEPGVTSLDNLAGRPDQH